jgi:hypothetical protein
MNILRTIVMEDFTEKGWIHSVMISINMQKLCRSTWQPIFLLSCLLEYGT